MQSTVVRLFHRNGTYFLKYHPSFAYIVFKVDEVRINQIYEQAKWQILTEEVECTEEEAITFAALQFQIKAASQSPQNTQGADEVDDIDAALNDLQVP